MSLSRRRTLGYWLLSIWYSYIDTSVYGVRRSCAIDKTSLIHTSRPACCAYLHNVHTYITPIHICIPQVRLTNIFRPAWKPNPIPANCMRQSLLGEPDGASNSTLTLSDDPKRKPGMRIVRDLSCSFAFPSDRGHASFTILMAYGRAPESDEDRSRQLARH